MRILTAEDRRRDLRAIGIDADRDRAIVRVVRWIWRIEGWGLADPLMCIAR
jgi:hypothetical protein